MLLDLLTCLEAVTAEQEQCMPTPRPLLPAHPPPCMPHILEVSGRYQGHSPSVKQARLVVGQGHAVQRGGKGVCTAAIAWRWASVKQGGVGAGEGTDYALLPE